MNIYTSVKAAKTRSGLDQTHPPLRGTPPRRGFVGRPGVGLDPLLGGVVPRRKRDRGGFGSKDALVSAPFSTLLDSRQDARSGAALVTVMCFALLVSVMVAIVLKASVSNVRGAQEQINLEKALYVAQAGLETAAYRLGKDNVTPPWAGDGMVGEGSFCVVVIAGATPAAGWHSLGGEFAVNPNNSPDNELTIKLADGTIIDRDDLTQDYQGYLGPATNVVVKPKGGGSQVGLLVDGKPYPFSNSMTYDVYSLTMTIYVYNDHVNAQGKAIGKWHVAMAATEAEIQSY